MAVGRVSGPSQIGVALLKPGDNVNITPHTAIEQPARLNQRLLLRGFHRVLIVTPLLFVLAMAHAEVKEAAGDGFLIVFTQRVEATPAQAYAALSQVDRWWSSDHTYSGDAANMSLKAEAGACFCERWQDNSVEHGTVILALRDTLLRLNTALGPLQGKAVTGVLSFQFKPDDKATLLAVAYRVNGAAASALDKDAPAVDRFSENRSLGSPASPQPVSQPLHEGPSFQPRGATLTTSSAVVTPASTLAAPETRNGFMPSLYACSRITASSASWWIIRRNAGVSVMIS